MTELRKTSVNDATIYLADCSEFPPEEMAMLRAFYSRSTESIQDRVRDLDVDQIKEKLNKFYINYGHKSIGDCSDITLFFEDVSILAAKYLQHNALYNGQETSTRYYDFSTRGVYFPYNDQPEVIGNVHKTANEFISSMQHVYSTVLDKARARLTFDCPHLSQNAINARAFDIARSLILCGAKTKLSVKMTLSALAQHLSWLIECSGNSEASTLASKTFDLLKEHYPSSFSKLRPFPKFNYDFLNCLPTRNIIGEFTHTQQIANTSYVSQLAQREKFSPLPREVGLFARFQFNVFCDFGSYRDIHRHRAGITTFPNVSNSMEYSFNEWYIEQFKQLDLWEEKILMPDGTTARLNDIVLDVIPDYLEHLNCVNAEIAGYLNPLGRNVRFVMDMDLAQAIYVSELRSEMTVHPSARKVAHYIGEVVNQSYPGASKFDRRSDQISIKRGEQTIKENRRA